MDLVKINHDYETYSDVDLKAVGAWAYSEHPSTRVLSWARSVGDGPVELWTPYHANYFPEVYQYWNYIWESYNAWFEYCIWVNVLKLPPLPVRNISCTRARSLSLALPRNLGDVARELHLPTDKQKDKRGKELIKKLCVPQYRGRGKNKEKYINRDVDLLRELYAYNIQDVITEREVSKRLPELSPPERLVWEKDFEINIRGVPIDGSMIENAPIIFEKAKGNLRTRLVQDTGMSNPSSGPQFKDYLAKHGYFPENLQKHTVEALLKIAPATLGTVIKNRSSLIRTPATKYASIKEQLGIDGRFHGALTFHLANTGRWSSTGVNFQNLNHPTLTPEQIETCVELMNKQDDVLLDLIFGDAIEALISCLRGILYAEPGNKLVVRDYKSVESRVLAWLAGQHDKLDIFRSHGKIYEHNASGIYGVPIDNVAYDQRQGGKITELACGFGGSVNAVIGMAQKLRIDLNALAVKSGFPDQESFASDIVKKWRKANPAIVNFWKRMERAAIATVQTGRAHMASQNIMYERWRDFLLMHLPTGRRLAFKEPHFTEGRYGPQLSYWRVDGVTKKWSLHTTHGGDQAQSATQGYARDLLAYSVPELEDAGYKIVMLTHDEAIAHVPENFGSGEEMSAIMCKEKPWNIGLPLDTDGFEARRNRK